MSRLLLIALLLAVGLLLAVLYWRWRQAHERRAALFAFAAARGWDFAFQDHTLATRWFAPPFGRGQNRRATNVVTGTAHGRPLLAFDYAFDVVADEESGPLGRKAVTYSVVVVPMPTYLPWLELAPEARLDRVRDSAGLPADLDLESDAFNRRYRIRAHNPKFASDVLNPRTMEMLLAREPLTVRFDGTDAVSVVPGTLEPMDLVRRASSINQILDGIPAFVWRDHGVAR